MSATETYTRDSDGKKLLRSFIRTDARTMWRCFTRSVVDYGFSEKEAISLIAEDVSHEIKRLTTLLREQHKELVKLREAKK